MFAVTILLGLRPLHFGDLNFAYSMDRYQFTPIDGGSAGIRTQVSSTFNSASINHLVKRPIFRSFVCSFISIYHNLLRTYSTDFHISNPYILGSSLPEIHTILNKKFVFHPQVLSVYPFLCAK